MLQSAFTAGVAAEGVDVIDLGVLPTPAVSAVALERGAAAAVVSASHNPFTDNGIKLLGPGGAKLTEEQELEVEKELARLTGESATASTGPRSAGGPSVGRVRRDRTPLDWYCQKVVSVLDGRRLDGLRVVLDCANGAAWETAPRIVAATGAELVEVLSAEPDGTNINAGCGSTHPGALQSAVVGSGASVGLALDGDADRVIAVDDRGELVDGDHLLALFARDMHARGLLDGSTVVVTVMSNLGFHRAMRSAGIAVHETPVGDRHVVAALDAGRWSLGGEQSGHLIFPRHATTGDGVLTGVLLLDLVARSATSLHDMAEAAMVRMPQVIRNVAVADPAGLPASAAVWDEVRTVERELGSDGRVLLRPSGTERLVRVMVEAPTQDEAQASAERLAAAVASELGDPT
jgi:phosphoglucosamine mutase